MKMKLIGIIVPEGTDPESLLVDCPECRPTRVDKILGMHQMDCPICDNGKIGRVVKSKDLPMVNYMKELRQLLLDNTKSSNPYAIDERCVPIRLIDNIIKYLREEEEILEELKCTD